MVGALGIDGTSQSINWGDGTSSVGTLDPTTGEVTGTHTYADAGIYHGMINYTNSDHLRDTVPI